MPNLPENKMKEEVYSNLGGINSKVGLYSNGPMEFQDMSNFDFQRPGALTQRWGSTLYQTQNFSGPISSLYEYVKLNGSSYLIVGTSGAIWSGATTGQAQGLSLTVQNATLVQLAGFAVVNYTTPVKNLTFSTAQVYYQDNTSIVLGANFVTGVTFYVNPQTMRSNALDFVTFQDYLFMGDGNVFLKYEGTTTSPIGVLPATMQGTVGISYSSAASLIGLDTTLSGLYSYNFYGSYINRRGLEGPIWPLANVGAQINGVTATTYGGTYAVITIQMNTPLQYDLASIKLYAYGATSNNSFSGGSIWNLPYKSFATVPVSGSTLTPVVLGTTIGGQANLFANIGVEPPLFTYDPIGLTLIIPSGTAVSEIDIQGYNPRYLELYQNRLFCSGFSASPSVVQYSDVAEPEGFDSTFNIEVRTNDGDRITGLREYNSRLYIFKQFSFSELSGDNPNNFFERQVSGQYGCLSNRAMVVYNDIMLFLDAKGVMQFNGAGLQCISNKMQPVFDTMNIPAALDQATMVHDKSRNEILIGIPINGSTTNNVTIVYDYMIDQWTKYDGYSPAIYAIAKQRFTTKTALYGGYSGQVMNFGQSLMSDNGQGFTTYFKTGFHSDDGYTATKLWRRLWTNVDEVTGATVACNINFFQDYGASVILNRTTYLSPFQTRLDFGIQSKSIAFEFSKNSATTMIRYYGHGLAYRHERNV